MTKKRTALAADEAACIVVHPALKEYFTYRFYKVALRLRAEVNGALAKESVLGLHIGLLRVLEVGGLISQVALGRSMGIDKATMVKLLDDLEDRQLIQRISVEGDRRVKQVRITPAGARCLKKGSVIREQVETRFFSVLSPAERLSLDRSLSKLIG